MATWEDRLYGVPLYADVSLLFWNKGLFEQAGLDPEVPPTNLQEMHDMAAAINDPDNGVFGYYLAGNCAGCNIFTFAPLIWASGGTIEPTECGDEALVGDSIPTVLELARMMHQEGLIDPAAQAETGATFAEVLRLRQRRDHGHRQLQRPLPSRRTPTSTSASPCSPGWSPDRRLVRRRRHRHGAEGLRPVEDAVEFMRFILSDQVQNERLHGGSATCRPAPTSSSSMTTRTSPTRSRHYRSPRRRSR